MTVQDRRARLRDTLLEVAEGLVATQGLDALKARDLAREAGCAVGAIYNVFDDLDMLILAVNLRTLAVFETYFGRFAPAAPSRQAAADYLCSLGISYLAFASEHPLRWRALFQHRLDGDRQPPEWYTREQARLFTYIEEPLDLLSPGLTAEGRHLLARTLFSATHGIISLGLDKKLLALPVDVLRGQIETLVRAVARGLGRPD